MKRTAAILLAIVLIGSSVPVAAQQCRTKGASAKACASASDQAIFNRVGDWFATIGKSDTEKKAILAERKLARAAKRAEKKAAKLKRKTGL
jgi:hypothetical protein